MMLSGFGDEISPDLQEQIHVMLSENIIHLEMRSIWGKNVLDLSDEEIATARDTLDRHHFHVSCIGSPIGKVKIDEDFEQHLERFRRALYVANYFRAPFVRIFSFYGADDDNISLHRDDVMDHLQVMVDEAASFSRDITLVHENEADIFGMLPEPCEDIHQTIVAPANNFGACFDAGNFVMADVHPFTRAYPLLKPYIRYCHIKDGLFADKRIVPAGQGDGQIKEYLADQLASGYDGFLSIEPHLAHRGRMGGFSGADLFTLAAQALKKLCAEAGAPLG